VRPGHAVGRVVRLLTGPAGLGPAVALALIALLAAFLATAGPRESTRLQNDALRKTLAASPAFGIFASGESTVTGSRQMITPKQLSVASGVLGSALFPPLVSPQAERWSAVTSPQATVLNPASRAVLVGPPVFETDYLGPLAGNTRLLSGSYPRTASATHKAGKTVVTMQCVVTRATASRFGLRAGSLLTLQSQASSLGAVEIVLKVTGLIKPVNPGGSFWNYDPPAAAPTVVNGSYWAGGALIGPSELAAFPAAYPQQEVHAAWAFPLETRTLTVAQVSPMIQAMTNVAASSIGNLALTRTHIQLSSAPTLYAEGLGTLTTFQAGQAAAGAVDALLTDGLFAVALILLLACALVVSDAYDAEVSLILARGGSTRQAALRILGRGAVAAVPALVAGVVVGLAVTPGGGPPEIWLVAAVAVTALGAPPLITAWRHRGARPAAKAERTDLVVPTHSRRRLVAEATVLIAIVGAVVALRVRGVSPGSGSDPYLSSAPVLVAVAAGLIAARVYPVPLRLLLRVTSPRKAPVGFLGIARAARSRSAALLPGLALVVALAVIALGGTLRAAVNRGQVAASWQQVGADVVIRSGGSQQVIGPVPQRAFAAVPGVTHTAAIDLVAPGDPQAAQLLTGTGSSVSTGVLVVNPRQYAALTAATPFPAFRASLLAQRGSSRVVPVIASPAVATALKKGASQLAFASSTLTVRLAATQAHTPGLPDSGPFVIMPSWAARSLKAGAPPNVLLATGADINERDLHRALVHTLPAGQILSRQAVLTAKTQLPSVRESNLAFELCVAAAVAVSIAAVLLGLLLSGRDRTRVAAWLAALGMTARQARRLAMLDALPLVLIAVLGAEVAGAVLAPTVAPALDLSVFTGSSAAVPVRLDAVSMIAPALAAIVLVVVITAAQNTLTRRRTKTGVLRLDEGR
jgi:putative ABC transport system permease protein